MPCMQQTCEVNHASAAHSVQTCQLNHANQQLTRYKPTKSTMPLMPTSSSLGRAVQLGGVDQQRRKVLGYQDMPRRVDLHATVPHDRRHKLGAVDGLVRTGQAPLLSQQAPACSCRRGSGSTAVADQPGST